MTAPSAEGRGAAMAVRGLCVNYASVTGHVRALDGVDLTLSAGSMTALIGASGSGKSTLVHAVLGLLPPNAQCSGRLEVAGVDLTTLDADERRRWRWTRVGTVLQASTNAWHPFRTLADHAIETARVHRSDLRRHAVRAAFARCCADVGLDPTLVDRHSHQLSGGMRQRAALALALLGEPQLLVADEPTAGLDTVARHQLLSMLRELQQRTRVTVLVATHDLAAIAGFADTLVIMDAGSIVESGAVAHVLGQPRHAATRTLVDAARALDVDRGTAGAARAAVGGRPAATAHVDAALTVDDVTHTFAASGGRWLPSRRWLRRARVARGERTRLASSGGTSMRTRAVEGVSLQVAPGECLGVVGASGAGKTTLGRLIAGLLEPSRGTVHVASTAATRRRRCDVQMIVQDPFGALDPRHTIVDAVAEPLHTRRLGAPRSRRDAAVALLEQVGIPAALVDRWPHELSGGQRQRVAIARALIARPSVIVADEPTSMLDASARLDLAELLAALAHERGVALVHITHDVALARRICDRIAVLDAGRIVELAPAATLFATPAHPATVALLDALPRLPPAEVGRTG